MFSTHHSRKWKRASTCKQCTISFSMVTIYPSMTIRNFRELCLARSSVRAVGVCHRVHHSVFTYIRRIFLVVSVTTICIFLPGQPRSDYNTRIAGCTTAHGLKRCEYVSFKQPCFSRSFSSDASSFETNSDLISCITCANYILR